MLPSENGLVLETAVIGGAVYMGSMELARRVSTHLSDGYKKLSADEKLEWDGRLPSTIHAVLITAATAWLFFCTDVFREGGQPGAGDGPLVLRTSPLSDACLGFSLGYFVTDLLLIAFHYPAFGGPEMGLHHLVALASVAAAAFQGQGHAYTLALLATECTTPFVNARYVLDKGGWKEGPLYTANGMALLLSWLVARILLFLKFFHHVASHRHELAMISPVSRWLILLVPPTLFALNAFWFTKILKGALKLMAKELRRGRPAAQAAPAAVAAGAGEASKDL